jgi:hypothetical protein
MVKGKVRRHLEAAKGFQLTPKQCGSTPTVAQGECAGYVLDQGI